MAKSQTARSSTIKNDPFASLIPDRISEQTNDAEPKGIVTPIRPEPEAKPVESHKKEKITVHLTHGIIERVKNAAYWNPRLTIASIAEIGMKYAIEQVEKENGGPYPQREQELKGGRPIGS